MKIISLNTWGGKYFDPLIEFIGQTSQSTDIYCFQEIYDTTLDVKQYKQLIRANLLTEIKNILKDFQVFYFPTLSGYDDEANPADFDLLYGPAIFIRNSIAVNSHQDYIIFQADPKIGPGKDFSNLTTPLQYIEFTLNNKEFSLFNFHGNPFPADKLDSENRLREFKKVKEIINTKRGPKIVVGDFNIFPQTQSLKILEEGMRNLIKEYNIERTRSKLSPYFGKENFHKFADYTLVSPDINVQSFQVPDIEVSDHLPMILDFDF